MEIIRYRTTIIAWMSIELIKTCTYVWGGLGGAGGYKGDRFTPGVQELWRPLCGGVFGAWCVQGGLGRQFLLLDGR
jgi:hypothetical protein